MFVFLCFLFFAVTNACGYLFFIEQEVLSNTTLSYSVESCIESYNIRVILWDHGMQCV
ncbi:MAG: hypothetical protein ACI95C_002812 [Pseudohongiellaceae bacterium]|jgi:hypothetical protein